MKYVEGDNVSAKRYGDQYSKEQVKNLVTTPDRFVSYRINAVYLLKVFQFYFYFPYSWATVDQVQECSEKRSGKWVNLFRQHKVFFYFFLSVMRLRLRTCIEERLFVQLTTTSSCYRVGTYICLLLLNLKVSFTKKNINFKNY